MSCSLQWARRLDPDAQRRLEEWQRNQYYRVILPEKIQRWLTEAPIDEEAFALEEVARHPALRDAQLAENARHSKPVSPLDRPFQSTALSRNQIRTSIITDLLIGGIGAGLLVMIIAAFTGYLEVMTQIPGWVYALLFVIAVAAVVCGVYRKAAH